MVGDKLSAIIEEDEQVCFVCVRMCVHVHVCDMNIFVVYGKGSGVVMCKVDKVSITAATTPGNEPHEAKVYHAPIFSPLYQCM